MLNRFCLLQKTLIMAFLAVALAGCASQPVSVASPQQYKTVAIVSLLPPTFTMSYIGVTVFGNRFAEFPLNFDPNLVARQTATTLLASRYQVRNLNLNETQIMASIPKDFSTTVLQNTAPLVQAQLEKLIKPGTVDLILVIDGSAPNPVNHLSPANPGIGLFMRGQFALGGSNEGSGIIAPFEVFDGHSFQQIALTFAGQGLGPPSSLSWKGESYDSLSDSDKATLNDIGKQVIGMYVTTSLAALNLTN